MVLEPHLVIICLNPNSLNSQKRLISLVCLRFCMSLHVKEGIRVHDVYCEPKFYKFKLLGKLVVQHSMTPMAL